MIKIKVQNSRSKKNLKLSIYFYLKQGKNIKDICSILNLKYSAISYHLRLLRESGSIRKIGYGVWEALEYQEKEVQKIKVGNLKTSTNLKFPKKDNRGHAFRFKIKIPKLYNWANREKYLIKKNIKYKVINKGYTHRILFRDCKVWLNSSSIVVYFPPGLSFFGKSAKDSEERAVFEMIEIMRGLDNLFNTSFKINKKYHIRVFGKHHGHVKNALAKMYNDEGRRIAIFNEDGQWLIIDDSFDMDELETVGCSGKNDSTKDMDEVVKPFFNKLKENPFTSDNIVDMQKKIGFMMSDYMKTIKVFDERMEWMAENNKSHQTVLEGIQSAITELRREINNGKNNISKPHRK